MCKPFATCRLLIFATLASWLFTHIRAAPASSAVLSLSDRRCKRQPADKPKSAPKTDASPQQSIGSNVAPINTTSPAPQGNSSSQHNNDPNALVVGSGGSFSTVQSAVSAAASKCSGAGGGVTIVINPGTYREQVHVPSGFPCKLTVRGGSGGRPTITFNGARTPYASTATLSVESRNTVEMYNLHVENTFGRGAQAVALWADGPGRQAYYDCQFDGYQDTCYGGAAKTFFGRCSITGATDFIWGGDGIGWYENCKVTVTAYGWVTASGRSSGSSSGYIVLDKCSIDGPGKAQSFLGRPWGAYARAVVQNSEIGGVIKSTGWDKWDNQDKPNAQMAEYGNTGSGAQGVRSNSKTMGKPLSMTEVLGDTSWIDSAYLS